MIMEILKKIALKIFVSNKREKFKSCKSHCTLSASSCPFPMQFHRRMQFCPIFIGYLQSIGFRPFHFRWLGKKSINDLFSWLGGRGRAQIVDQKEESFRGQ